MKINEKSDCLSSLYGIEHLAQDEKGYVCWRGERIEPWPSHLDDREEGRLLAEILAIRCHLLEERGEPVTMAALLRPAPETEH